jgi:hypothetical protein
MKMTKFYLGLIGVLLLAAGCNLDSDTVVVPDVEDEFYLELAEDFENGNRSLNWKLRTIESVGCEDAGIDYTFHWQEGQTLVLSINQVLTSSDCDPADEPARALVEIGTLSNGFYPVSIALRETLEREGTLRVSDSFFQIEIESGGGVLPLRERLFRMPEHTLWGYIDHQGIDSLSNAAADFYAELEQITERQVLTDGHYGFFESRNNGDEIFFPEIAASASTTLAFQRTLTADRKTAVIELINTYRETYEELRLVIGNTYGEAW